MKEDTDQNAMEGIACCAFDVGKTIANFSNNYSNNNSHSHRNSNRNSNNHGMWAYAPGRC